LPRPATHGRQIRQILAAGSENRDRPYTPDPGSHGVAGPSSGGRHALWRADPATRQAFQCGDARKKFFACGRHRICSSRDSRAYSSRSCIAGRAAGVFIEARITVLLATVAGLSSRPAIMKVPMKFSGFIICASLAATSAFAQQSPPPAQQSNAQQELPSAPSATIQPKPQQQALKPAQPAQQPPAEASAPAPPATAASQPSAASTNGAASKDDQLPTIRTNV